LFIKIVLTPLSSNVFYLFTMKYLLVNRGLVTSVLGFDNSSTLLQHSVQSKPVVSNSGKSKVFQFD